MLRKEKLLDISANNDLIDFVYDSVFFPLLFIMTVHNAVGSTLSVQHSNACGVICWF